MKRKFTVVLFLVLCIFLLTSCQNIQNGSPNTSTEQSVETQNIVKSEIKVAFFDARSYDKEAFVSANNASDYGYTIDYFEEKLTEETCEKTKGHQFVCVFVNDQVNDIVLKTLAEYKVKGIILRCTGYDNVDLAMAQKLGIRVLNVPKYSPDSIAEFAVAMMLTLMRHIPEAIDRTNEGNFNLEGLQGRTLKGLTVGIVGAGTIGKVAALILKGFGVKVLLNNLTIYADWAKEHGFTYTDLETLLKESDIVSIHCPLNSENYHMINAERLALMKKSALLINTARGALVDTKALISALQAGDLGGAALDVYENERDYFFEDHSDEKIEDEDLLTLLSMKNVLITGHQAFLTDTSLSSIAEISLGNIMSVVKGERSENDLIQE